MPGSSAPNELAARPAGPRPPAPVRPPLRELAGNAPLALDRPGALWRVESGTVELFAVRGAAGVRYHLATLPAGALLFGAAGVDGLSLLAVGLPGTQLLALADPERPERQAPLPGAELAAGLDGWLLAISRRLSPPSAPKQFVDLIPGTEAGTAAGETARPRSGLVWARGLAGRYRFLGEEGLEIEAGGLVALSERTWLAPVGPVDPVDPVDLTEPVGPAGDTESGEAGRLETISTADLLAGGQLAGDVLTAGRLAANVLAAGPLADGLALTHRLLLRRAAHEMARAEGDERERLGRKAALDRRALAGAQARLAAVLSPLPRGEVLPTAAADPLFAACQLVARAQGIEIRPLPEETVASRRGDRLAAICSASRVRCRRVILRRDWWRRDNGPLLAFLPDAEGGPAGPGAARRPVALLPVSSRSYELVEPDALRPRRRVDLDLAETLAGDAYMLYPPLPERPVGWRDLAAAALRDRRRDLGTIALMGVAGGLLALLVPILSGRLFGSVIPAADRPQLLEMVLGLVVAAVAGGLFQLVRSIAVLRLGGKMDGSLQAAVWDRLLALPAGFFRRFTVGDLADRSMGIDAIRELLTGNVLTSILAAVFSLASFGLLFFYSARLAVLAVALIAVLMAATATLVYLQLRRQRELLDVQGRISSLLFGLIGGIAKLRLGGAELRAYALWAERFAEQRRWTARAQRIANLQTTLSAIYGVLTSLALFAMVGLTAEAQLPVGDFLAFNAAFAQFLSAALAMIAVFSSALTLVPIYERLGPILQEVPEVDAAKADPGELAGEIEFSHVSFRYQADGPPVLDDVSFRARPGEFIALVGPSGSGKSTCLRLILGFERPASGSIYFDGQDLASLAVQQVRRQIGVVLQHGRPIAGDIFSNIIGGSNLGIDDAWEAARMAGLAEDIQAMPMGMHTVISESAGTFSGGQKQRLLIARAVVNRPRILLFDEATSALDNRTQETVSRSLERLAATRIVIAHRLSTIMKSDRIYVIAAGRVVESGSYEELVGRGGPFTRLALRQLV